MAVWTIGITSYKYSFCTASLFILYTPKYALNKFAVPLQGVVIYNVEIHQKRTYNLSFRKRLSNYSAADSKQGTYTSTYNSFVNTVYLYDDHLVFIGNYKDSTKTITFAELEAAGIGSDLLFILIDWPLPHMCRTIMEAMERDKSVGKYNSK